MNFISVAERIGLNLAAYMVALLYLAPALVCIRRSLIFIVSQEYRDRSWIRRPSNLIAFLVGAAFSVFLAGAAIQAIAHRQGITPWPFVAAVGLSFLVLMAGVAFVRDPSRLAPVAANSEISISPQLGQHSDVKAKRIFLARFWVLRSAHGMTFVVMLPMTYFILTSGNAKDNTRALENLLVIVTVVLIGLPVAMLVIQLFSPTLTALSRANILLLQAGEAKGPTPWPSKEGIKMRSDLYAFASSVARLARRLERRDPSHPGAFLYRGIVDLVRTELTYASSLSGSLSSEMGTLIIAASSLIIGGVEKATYDQLIGMTETFDGSGHPAKELQRHPGRLSRAARAVARNAEPTDKLVTTFTKVLGLVLAVLLAFAGQLTISEFLKNLKP